jgi:micrococcal nuclease
VGWLLLFWLLVPLLIWKTNWGIAWKVVATLALVFLLAGIGSQDAPSLSSDQVDGAGSEDEAHGRHRAPRETNAAADTEGARENQPREWQRTRAPESPGRSFTVSRVVDGDTVEVQTETRVLDVRLIGVDTPETVHPSLPVQCFGPRASSFATTTLQGERVRLEFDVERRDPYGRTLAYLWLDGALFNETLIKRGFGRMSTYAPNERYLDRFEVAQRAASSNDRGLWGACRGGDGDAGGKESGSASKGGSRCDANYKGACIASYPPDLDCPDVAAAGFSSVGTDPHGFDGDGDGVACE